MTEIKNSARTVSEKLLSITGEDVSRHLDELLDDYPTFPKYGVWCLSVFVGVVENLRILGDNRVVVWVIPMPTSNYVSINRMITINDVTKEESPSTVYLIRGNRIFSEANEEYRKVINLSINNNIIGIYRSWRDERAAKFGWEYSNGIYLLSRCVS